MCSEFLGFSSSTTGKDDYQIIQQSREEKDETKTWIWQKDNYSLHLDKDSGWQVQPAIREPRQVINISKSQSYIGTKKEWD